MIIDTIYFHLSKRTSIIYQAISLFKFTKKMISEETHSQDKKSPTFYTKNSFIFSHNGFSFQKAMKKTVKELQGVVSYLEKNEEKILSQKFIEMKHLKVLLKYKPMLFVWANTQFFQQQQFWLLEYLYQGYTIRRELPRNCNVVLKCNDPKQKQYWENTKKVHADRFNELKNMTQIKKPKQKQRKEKDDSSGTIVFSEDALPASKKKEGPVLRQINPHLMTLVNYITELMQFTIHLPTLINVKLLGIKEMDQVNEKATVALEIEMKTKIPDNSSEQFLNLLKLQSLFVKSGNFKKQEGVQVLFNQCAYDDPNQSASIWKNISEYINFTENWKDEPFDELSQRFSHVDADNVIIYRAVVDTTCKITTYDFNSPFDLLDIQGTVELFPIYSKIDTWEEKIKDFFYEKLNEISPLIVVKLNLIHNHEEQMVGTQIFAEKNIEIDNHEIANSLMKLQISDSEQSGLKLRNNFCGWKWVEKNNKQKDKNEREKKQSRKDVGQVMYKPDSYAHFHFPFYRDPINPLIAIFVTNVVLGVITFFIFFQDPQDLADKIANIAALLISFVAMIAILQEQMKRSKLSITAILIYLMILTPLLCMADTMYLYERPDLENQPLSNPLFWICVIITGLNVVYPILMVIIYLCCLKPQFKSFEKKSEFSLFPGHPEYNNVKENELSSKYDLKKLRMNVEPGESLYPLEDQLKEFGEKIYFEKMAEAYSELQKLGDFYKRISKYFTGERKDIFLSILMKQNNEGLRIGGSLGTRQIQSAPKSSQNTNIYSVQQTSERNMTTGTYQNRAAEYNMQNIRNYTNTTSTSTQNYTQTYSRPQNYQGSVQSPTLVQNYNQGPPVQYTTQTNNFSQGSPVQYTTTQNPIITTTSQPVQNISTSYQYMPDPYPKPPTKYQQVREIIIERVPMMKQGSEEVEYVQVPKQVVRYVPVPEYGGVVISSPVQPTTYSTRPQSYQSSQNIYSQNTFGRMPQQQNIAEEDIIVQRDENRDRRGRSTQR